MQAAIKPFSLIVAVSKSNGIGFKGTLPWPSIPGDMKHFREVTSMKEPLSMGLSDLALKSCFY
jgi:dihydrofolate reductase